MSNLILIFSAKIHLYSLLSFLKEAKKIYLFKRKLILLYTVKHYLLRTPALNPSEHLWLPTRYLWDQLCWLLILPHRRKRWSGLLHLLRFRMLPPAPHCHLHLILLYLQEASWFGKVLECKHCVRLPEGGTSPV